MSDHQSLEKNQGLQIHNGRGGSIVFFAILVFLVIFVDPRQNSEQQKIHEIGLQKAKIIAYQIYQIYNRHHQTGRGPASVQNNLSGGEMGKDPWGHAYRYRIIYDAHLNKRKLIVWSLGSNGNVDTPALLNDEHPINNLTYLGDDFGFEIQMLN